MITKSVTKTTYNDSWKQNNSLNEGMCVCWWWFVGRSSCVCEGHWKVYCQGEMKVIK